jgi:nicotinamidase/pyrazinamidase
MGTEEDAYSAFQARDEAGRPLAALLQQQAIQHLYVMGLATDYCVKESTLSAVAAGLRVSVVSDGIRAVDLQPGDGARALEEIRAAGGEIIASPNR